MQRGTVQKDAPPGILSSLEAEFQCELNDPRRIRLGRVPPESRRADSRIRIGEECVVEEVEELASEAELHCFPNGEHLSDLKVPLLLKGPADIRISRQGSVQLTN